ncbi:MAG: cytochrome c biogenesis protein ResB [Bdellovibrionota bacterium]
MNSILPLIQKNKIFRFFSSVKFAIPILFVFAFAMTYGTIVESTYGSEYVKSAVYQTWWFYLIQGSIVLTIFLAMISRLPYRKRLTGFYTVHVALITIAAGSLITHYYGVDGTIELNRGEAAASLHLGEKALYVALGEHQKILPLPETNNPTKMDKAIKLHEGVTVTLLEYFPYAKEIDATQPKSGAWSSEWQVKNDRFEQHLEIGNDLAGKTPTQPDLGPLHVEFLAEELSKNLGTALAGAGHTYVLLNKRTGNSFFWREGQNRLSISDEGKSGSLQITRNEKAKLTYFSLSIGGKELKFFPKFSPLPLSGHMETDPDSDYRFFSLQEMGVKNSVFLSPLQNGNIRMVIGKGKTWQTHEISAANPQVELPWMGFKLTLLKNNRDAVRVETYGAARANKEEEKNFSAASLLLEAGNVQEHLWATNRAATQSPQTGAEIYIGLTQKPLPFTLKLDRFEMQMAPGTDKPASYESFVKVVDTRPNQGGESLAHIFMNNPLKKDGYTFYQSSYLQDDNGEYHSVLSVNRDPGRPVKYAGALLLVFGLILHFGILYGKIKL